MKKSLLVLGLVAGFALVLGGSAFGDDDKKVELPKCPVMGETISFKIAAKTDDGPVYVCCKMCVSRIEKDSSKYAKQIAGQRAILAKMPKVQVKCPLSGMPIDPESFATVAGKKVYACCSDCTEELKTNGDKHKAAIAASYTYQARCPVMPDEEINPAMATKLATGETVYFCCKMCVSKFTKDPAKYADNMAKMGYPIDVAKLKAADGK